MRVLSYGGGRQTVAICVLIAQGKYERPDRIVMADTGRENPMTWEYLETHIRPMMRTVGLEVEVAPHSLATVDIYAHNGDLLIPAFTATGKLSGWCSGEWKREPLDRFLRQQGIKASELWIGYSLDERRRVTRMLRSERDEAAKRFPLVEMMITTDGCAEVIARAGLPQPHRSSCWMCPHKANAEWATIKNDHLAEWSKACELDEEIRAHDIENGNSGVWLHHSRTPLREADLSVIESTELRQCGLGMCFV
jgi:3'-phosphoadenosine 5'-phosphosulfate sulfotransferase (PAPS reductase)/FAD synthetase